MPVPLHTGSILFTPTANVLAHVSRCVVLASELKQRGHRIAFAGTPKYLKDPAVVGDEAFEFYPLTDFDLDEGLDILRTISRLPKERVIEEIIAAELQMLDRVRPRVVIVDFRPTMYISARLRRIPLIALLGGHWLYQFAAKPNRAFRTYAIYPLMKRLVGVKGADLLMPPLQRLAMRYKMLPFSAACKRHGLPPKRTPWEMLIGDDNLILDTELVSPTKGLPENFKQVGPIFWSPQAPLPQWIEGLDRGRPIIYVTLGSTAHPDLFRQILGIFRDTGYEIIMTTGGQIDCQGEEVPRNARLEKYLPGERMMALSDLVIHHGGAGTVYQTIRTGRPSIVIATHFEQEFLGGVLEEHGAGIFLTMKEVMADPARLSAAAAKILQNPDPYTANIKRLQEDLQRYDAVKSAADRIEAFVMSTTGWTP